MAGKMDNQGWAARALRVAMTRAEAHLVKGDPVAAMETLERGVETANGWLCKDPETVAEPVVQVA